MCVCVHVTEVGVWISAGIEVSLFLLPLQGHKTSYDTDGNSPPLVSPGESKKKKKKAERVRCTEGSERSKGEPHDCLCH